MKASTTGTDSRAFLSFLTALVTCCLCIAVLASGQAKAYDPEMGFQEQARQRNAFQLYQQAVQFDKAGDHAKAIEYYRRSISNYGKIKEVHHALAQALAKTGQTESAMNSFRGALDIDYNYVAARNNFGLLYKKIGKVKDAEREFKICIRIDPKYPYPYYNYGMIQREQGDIDGAIESFQTAVRLKPDFAEAYKELGLAIFERAKSGDLTLAMEQLEKASRLVPRNAVIHYHLGVIYCTKGNLDAGESEFRKALMCDPRFAAAHWELAKVRYYRGDLDRCISEIAEAERINPTYSDSHNYPQPDLIKMKQLKAAALEHRGDLIKAMDVYKELGELRRGTGIYQAHMADLDKRIRRELKQRRKPLPYDPEEVEAYIHKGIDLYEDGLYEDARAAFERALELDPSSARATINLSAVQEAMGDLDGAVANCQKAIALHPKYDGLTYNLAYLLEKMNLPHDAALQYKKYHDMGSSYPYDSRHIVELQQGVIRQQKWDEYARKRGY